LEGKFTKGTPVRELEAVSEGLERGGGVHIKVVYKS